MHGLVALDALNDFVFSVKDDELFIDLYTEGKFKKSGNQVKISLIDRKDNLFKYRLKLNLNSELRIGIRIPQWADVEECMVEKKDISANLSNGYIITDGPFDQVTIDITLKYKMTLIDKSRNSFSIEQLRDGTVTGVLKYGPYLMGIDDAADPEFTAEPNDNIIYIDTITPIIGKDDNPMNEFYLSADYRHSGFPSKLSATLRPISSLSFEKRPYLMLSLNFLKN